MGSVLRVTFFEEVIDLLSGRKSKKRLKEKNPPAEPISFNVENYFLNNETISKIINLTRVGSYKTFLIQCPDFLYEIKLMIKVVKSFYLKMERFF